MIISCRGNEVFEFKSKPFKHFYDIFFYDNKLVIYFASNENIHCDVINLSIYVTYRIPPPKKNYTEHCGRVFDTNVNFLKY